jgi:thiamine biosynthesis lipoprotein
MIEQIDELPPLHRFDHEAMNTTYELWFPAELDAKLAASAAREAFREVDRLEGLLSRFLEYSDITRININAGREMVLVDVATLEILRVASAVSAETGGAFDVTVGGLMSIWKQPGQLPVEPPAEMVAAARARTGMHLLALDEEQIAAGLGAEGAMIDLGAIGKGYAIDQIVKLLRDWDIESALVSGGGGSTMYALGAPTGLDGWPLGIGYGAEDLTPDERRMALRDMAVSASGTEIQGSHILDPRTGYPPVDRCVRAFSLNPSATVADALSTAFMVMNADEVSALCQRFGDVSALLVVEREGRNVLDRYGAWPGRA